MKWPSSLTILRHGQSAYNLLRETKEGDPVYQEFKEAFERDYRSAETRRLADLVRERFVLGTSDYDTPLTDEGGQQALLTGRGLGASRTVPLPDVVLCSPYLRTRQTWDDICLGWPEAADVPVVIEDRIREQEHGLALLYSDWRVFHVLHPEQKELHDLLGDYWYQFPQGESVSQVRDRDRDVNSMLIREYAGLNVFMVTHHLTILSRRANLERLSPEEFMRLDREEKPVNCGVTHYIGDPSLGRNGKLRLEFYNRKFY